MPSLKKPESFSREHRLGLVVYGGIALAIYMNGICQEFYNAVRGRGIYKLIKALTDADIVVDIISGTSAGGINGVLLSFALANNNQRRCLEFKKFAEVWKKSGDIRKLLFQKKYDGVEKASFFDGKGYYRTQLKQALESVWETSAQQTPKDDWFSEFGELDLFVTGTDVLGRIYKIFDNTGSAIEVKDHHTVFHLKYRDFGQNPFQPVDETTRQAAAAENASDNIDKGIVCDALAKLCQITSCFPIAFPPVTVRLNTETTKEDSEEEAREKQIDAKLVEWGDLKKNRLLFHAGSANSAQPAHKHAREIEDDPGQGPRLHFVDGGVLDNRPFSYTIKEIYYRTAERPVSRKLFYIDPSPDCLTNNAKYKEMHKPSLFKVAKDSLIGMPRYESINNDLEMIKEHNEKVRRYNFLQADVEELLDSRPLQDRENQDIADQQRYVCLRARLINIKDKLLPLIYLESNQAGRTAIIDTVAQLLTNSLSTPREYSQRLKLLEKLEKDVLSFDVEYALRKHFFITNYVFRLLDRNYLCAWIKKKKDLPPKTFIPEEDADDLISFLKRLIRTLNYHIKILEIVQEKLYQFFACNEIEDYFVKLLEDSQLQGEEYLTKKFPEDFYESMLQFYKNFLDVELPADFLELPCDFTPDDMEEKLNRLKKALDEKITCLRDAFKAGLDGTIGCRSRDKSAPGKSAPGNCILERLSQKTYQLLAHSEDKIAHLDSLIGESGKLYLYFKEFERIDAYLFPLDYLAGVPEKQIIETYRISPEDAKLGFSAEIQDGERLEHKLAGDSLNAFGGFFKESWRANDILWGRLDGLNRIIEALVTEKNIKSFLDFLRREAKIKVGFEAFLPGKADAKFEEQLESYLEQLLNEAITLDGCKKHRTEVDIENEAYLEEYRSLLKDQLKRIIKNLQTENYESWHEENGHKKSPEEREQRRIELQDIVRKELVPTLVSVGHLIILAQEFPGVVRTSIEEQLHWKQHKVVHKAKSRFDQVKQAIQPKQNLAMNAEFLPIQGGFNSVLTELAVVKLARESLGSMSLRDMEEFFYRGHLDGGYRISSETLKDIPKAELKKMALRFVRIFQDIFATWRRKTSRFKSTLLSQLILTIFAWVITLVLRILVRFF